MRNIGKAKSTWSNLTKNNQQSTIILENNTLPIRSSKMQASTPRAEKITSLFGLINSDKTVSLEKMQETIEMAALKQINLTQ